MPDNTQEPTQTTLFHAAPAGDERTLIDAYVRAGRTLDDLPYSPEFDQMVRTIGTDPRDVLTRLQRIRKAGRMPRGAHTAKPSPVARLTGADAALLEDLVRAHTGGTLGGRDALPYTPHFDAIVESFNARAGAALGPHDLWRLVARLAK